MAPSLDSTKVAKSKEVGCMFKLLEEVAIEISSTVVFWLFAAEIGSPEETSTLISFSSASLDTFLFFLLASQSDAHRIAPHRDPNPSIQSNPTYSSEARKTHDVIYF